MVVDFFRFAQVVERSDANPEVASGVDAHGRDRNGVHVGLFQPITQLDGIVPDAEAANLQVNTGLRFLHRRRRFFYRNSLRGICLRDNRDGMGRW